MNRLCIYMTYNKENRIYEYIGSALKSLKRCCTKVYVVCNHINPPSGVESVVPFTDHIFYRENKGYDSGAYKDIFCNFLSRDELEIYDEIVLANDSFFGFFYPLEDAFALMDESACDFWGMTGQGAGEYTNPLHSFDAHIHSYFLVFKRKVIENPVFLGFWEQMEYASSFREAIVNFELEINRRLKQEGFTGKSFIDVYGILPKRNENPYYSMPYELVKDCKVPVMKKKCVLVRNVGFASMLKTIQYLKQKNLYPVHWMLSCLENQFYVPGIGNGPCNSLEIFCNSHPEIYIYGAGVCGKNLAVYFAYRGWDYRGFIVTDNKKKEEHVLSIEEAEISAQTGIVISVIDAGVAEEIKKHISGRCDREQLFFMSDCDAVKLPC